MEHGRRRDGRIGIMSRRQRVNYLRYYYPLPAANPPRVFEADICVYGGTSGGVAAAVQAVRLGKTAVIAEFGRHLGGMSSSGLGATDIGNKRAIGGISREFYRALGEHYGQEEAWRFEPHVAGQIYDRWIAATGIGVFFEQRLKGIVAKRRRITEIVMENGHRYRAKMFLDCSYEGDLMARAGVSYHVGRESNAVYGECFNGVHFGHPNHNFKVAVDPWVTPGKPSSGLLAGISSDEPGRQGAGDHRVQAYNFRLCLTRAADRIAFPRPAGYDAARYTLLARYINAGIWDAAQLDHLMPNGKTDTNNRGGFSTDNIGMNYDWPDGDYAARERIYQDHVVYTQGLFWFLAHDRRLPREVRDQINAWGLPRDEFRQTGGWPHQLYVREARRMISDYVMTEHNCVRKLLAEQPVGLAAYTMDSHNCQRVVRAGRVMNEGNVEIGGFPPYPIAYRAILPRESECENLFVPVCLSASHIAYGSIRMEPVFMVLGQSAATAAAMAIDAGCPAQGINYRALRKQLLADRQVLDWDFPPAWRTQDPNR
jgi:hypothetical protein